MRALMLASLALAAALSGCATDRASKECKDVCRREAQCVEDTAEAPDGADNKFDQSECVAACSVLQREEDGEKLVADHLACASKAKDCTELLACQ